MIEKLSLRKVLFFIAILLLPLLAVAQELKVKSFEAAPFDLSASTKPRVDNNNNPCALVKVGLTVQGATFAGSIIGDVQRVGSDYWVYMPAGTKMLQIQHPNYETLMVNFTEFGIKQLDSKVTYLLRLVLPQLNASSKPAKQTSQKQTAIQPPIAYSLPSTITGSTVAASLYQKAMNEDVQAMCDLGKAYLKGENGAKKNENEAFRWLNKAAEAGNAHAMACLGDCYDGGYGTTQDYQQAYYWDKRSADLGDAYGLYNLGQLYENGVGVSMDKYKAFELYTKASSQGVANATCSLGACYLYGNGVGKDVKKAESLIGQSVSEGSTNGKLLLAKCYLWGTFNNNVKQLQEAFELFCKVASEPEAKFYLAYFSFHGLAGVSQDRRQAFAYYKQSAEAGNVHSMNQLGACYEKGYGCNVDKMEAFQWYGKAANAGNPMAMSNLGRLYLGLEIDIEIDALLYERGVDRKKEAFHLFSKSAEAGNMFGQYWLGVCYEKGYGVKKDKNMANEWFGKVCSSALKTDHKTAEEVINQGKAKGWRFTWRGGHPGLSLPSTEQQYLRTVLPEYEIEP